MQPQLSSRVDKSQIVTFYDPRLTTIVESSAQPLSVPSIVTVEATAVAKIFFETHFNKMLTTPDARRQRCRELEEKLLNLSLSPEVCRQAAKLQLQYESESLRRDRVLKSRSSKSSPPLQISDNTFDPKALSLFFLGDLPCNQPFSKRHLCPFSIFTSIVFN